MISTYQTLVEILMARGESQANQKAYTFLENGESEKLSLTYAELAQKAKAIAATLQPMTTPGERALLLYHPGLDFITAFYGCLCAGVIAVPAYPPDRFNKNLPRLNSIIKDAQPKIILSTSEIIVATKEISASMPLLENIKWQATNKIPDNQATHIKHFLPDKDDIAFLQYTSGSTASPKGVMVTHDNIMYNEAMIQSYLQDDETSIIFTWLPMFHDMGLIGKVLHTPYIGTHCIIMSPLSFLKKPVRWLKAISNYKVHSSSAPNFAYNQCLHRISPSEMAGLDLSHWKVALNGSEPVNYDTLEKFYDIFSKVGFRKHAFFPCYGLAEATLIVSGPGIGNGYHALTLDKNALENNKVVLLKDEKQASETKKLVSCGKTILEQKIRIVDPDTSAPCPDNQIGEIWVQGQNIAKGYWNHPKATAKTFDAFLSTGEGPFLRTGDLGFIRNNELYVTGRLKDLIKIRGRNIFPQDIENVVEQQISQFPEIRTSGIGAFSVDNDGEEGVVLLVEVVPRKTQNHDPDTLVQHIKQVVVNEFEIAPIGVVLINSGNLPKTSSGKIMRHACRKAYLNEFKDEGIRVQYEWKQISQVNPSVPQSFNESRDKADACIAWLRDYAETRINSRLIDERRSIPPHIVLDFGNQGLLGMKIPKQYGGLDLKHTDYFRILEQLAAIDFTLAVFTGHNNGLGIYSILHFGSENQKNEWLPLLATGRQLVAFAITEDSAGSNPFAMKTTAEKVDGGWLVNGKKVWIGSGLWAGLIIVFAKETNSGQIISFMVKQDSKGLKIGAEALTMGVHGMVQNEVFFENVLVTEADMLGTPKQGFEVAQNTMMQARLGLGVLCLGALKRCVQLMVRYASRRNINTGKLIENPITYLRLIELNTYIIATEKLVYQLAAFVDAGIKVPQEFFIACKTSVPEFLSQATDWLIQTLGSRGYIETNIAPQLARDSRLIRLFEGPTETLMMYLGSCMVSNPNPVYEFMTKQLRANKALDLLKKAINKIEANYQNAPARFPTITGNLQFMHSKIGEITTDCILLAAIECATKTNNQTLQPAFDFFKTQYSQHLYQAMLPIQKKQMASLKAIVDFVNGFSESIGDIESIAPSENHQIDPYLKREAREAVELTTPLQPIDNTKVSKVVPETKPLPTTSDSEQLQRTKPQSISSQEIQQWLIAWVAKEAKIPADLVSPEKQFSYYGLDSVAAVSLADDLEKFLKCPIATSLAYDYQTINELTDFLSKNNI